MLDLQPLPLAPPESLQAVVRKLEPVAAAARYVPAKEGIYAPLPDTIAPPLRDVLAERGIAQLYIHQSDALAETAAGRNCVIVTPTASGKTLCFNLPVLNTLLQDPGVAKWTTGSIIPLLVPFVAVLEIWSTSGPKLAPCACM